MPRVMYLIPHVTLNLIFFPSGHIFIHPYILKINRFLVSWYSIASLSYFSVNYTTSRSLMYANDEANQEKPNSLWCFEVDGKSRRQVRDNK